MPRHATERSLSVNALKKRSAGKSILVEMSQLAWDLDPYAKRRVQAILRRCGRGQDADLRILSDGEDGLRGVVGTWFGEKYASIDWIGSMLRDGSRESKRNSCISPMGMISRNAS